jgi:formate hydrogenlyase transcriptional activator
MMRAMSSPRRESDSLDVELLVDSIPALIHTARPDGYLDYFNRPWLEYLGSTLDKVAGWNWTAFVHPEDVEGIVAKWRACLATGEIFEYETRVRRANGEYRWMFHRKVPLRDANGNIVKWYGSSLDIEERKTAEDQLRRNAEELQRNEFYLAEGQRLAHMGSWAFDPDGFYYWSPELFRMYGLDPASKPPSVQEYLDCVHPQDRESMADLIKGILEKASPFDATKRIVRPNGEVRYIRCVGAPVVENQSLKKYVGSAIDVTEHELLTQELRRRDAYLTGAQRLSHTGSFGCKLSTGEMFWSEETFRIYGYDHSTKPSVERVLQRVHPEDRVLVQEHIDQANRDGKDCHVECRLLLPDDSVKHVLIEAHASKDESGNIEFVGAVTDVTPTKQAEQDLQRSEAYLAEAQKLSHTGSFGWRPDTGEIVWSDETYRIFVYEHAVKPTIDLLVQRVHPEDRPDFLKVIESASAGATQFEHTYRWLLPDGSVKHVHAIAHVLQDASGNREFVGAATDVTSIKRAEEDLRASERKYRHLVDTTPAFIHTALPDGSLDFLSRGWLEYGGLPQTDFLDWRWTAAIHPEDVEAFVDKWRAALASGEPLVAESRVRRADGEYRWFLHRNVPLRDETGKIVKWYGTGIDIEERKTAEEKIREQETELRQILDLVPQLVAVFGPGSERLYANRIGLDYVGLSLEEWRQTPGTFVSSRSSFIHPDDRERAARTYSDSARPGGSAFELELRLRKRDGTYRWFLARFNPLRDEQGQITRWYLASTDIEDRKRAEDKLRSENVALREEIDKASMFEEIVGTSPALKSALSRIAKVARSDSTVLITGETGTGKELVARAIHRRSDRASRAFVSVNCAAIPRDLIASELFGHEKGAFTGATQQRLGRFELANGGTLFLDEVGELPAETQISLLRVLQEHEFERVGGTRPIRADVRVIAATNRDLQAAISAGSFRSDLFYRLHVFPIEIPPLRERREDIPLLVEYFIDRYARKAGKNIKRVNKKTLELLQSYPWPGNIRELQNVMERSVILCETEIFSIDENWLPQPPPLTAASKQQVELPRRLLVQEKDMIEAALKDTGGRVSGPTGAAAKLGIPRSTLESKIRSLKINKNRFRA